MMPHELKFVLSCLLLFGSGHIVGYWRGYFDAQKTKTRSQPPASLLEP